METPKEEEIAILKRMQLTTSSPEKVKNEDPRSNNNDLESSS